MQPLKLWQKDFQFLPESPNLSQLLSRFELIQTSASAGFDASLFASIGMVPGNNQLPIAFYRYQSHLIQKNVKKGGDGYQLKSDPELMLCADPVHFEVGLNDITLTQCIDDLTEEQARECIEALNQHFKQDGLLFIYGSQAQWYVKLNAKSSFETTPLLDVLRKNVAHFFPASNAMNWDVIQNETQMILHSLPLNQKREMAGLPTLNSLWFYGGGTPEAVTNNAPDAIYSSNEGKGKMLSNAVGCDYMPLPENALNVLNNTANQSILILDQLMLPAIYDDVEAYQEQLRQLDEYLKPLINAWKSGKIDLIIDSCTGKLLKPKKIPSWQFWAKGLSSLTEIAE